jgi:hypothetical protein
MQKAFGKTFPSGMRRTNWVCCSPESYIEGRSLGGDHGHITVVLLPSVTQSQYSHSQISTDLSGKIKRRTILVNRAVSTG